MTEEINQATEIAELADRAHSELKPGLDKKLQIELGNLLGLFPRLAKSSDAILPRLAKIAIASLLSESPNIGLAKKLREGIEKRLNLDSSLIRSAIRGKSPAVRVVLGLGVLLYFVIPALIVSSAWWKNFDTIFGIETEMLGLVAFSGALGSIVSIMVRLHQFEDASNADQAIQFFTGLFKPIVGSAFALFIFAVLSSGLIPVAIQTEKARYFFAALSFVAGFSERFAQDVVTKTETTVIQSSGAKI
jgi:hypothetical protein